MEDQPMNRVQCRLFLLLALSFLVPFKNAMARDSDDRDKSRSQGALTLPVAGTIGNSGFFRGAVTIHRFASRHDQIVAVGTVRGTVTNAAGQVLMQTGVQ